MYMHIEFLEYIGELKNDTGINAKGIMFSALDDDGSVITNCILYVHESIQSFVTIQDNDNEELKLEVFNSIFKKYTLQQLLDL